MFSISNSTRDKLSVYILFLLFVTSQSELCLLGLDLLYEGNFSNPIHSKNCYHSITAFKITYSRGKLVFITASRVSYVYNVEIEDVYIYL